MTFDRYIIAFGSLSDNASLVFRTLCALSDGRKKFTLIGGSIADALGWPGASGRKRVNRAMAELVCSGLIIVSDGQNKCVELVKPVSGADAVKAVEDDKYKDLLQAANASLPKRSKLDKDLMAKLDAWIANHKDGEETILKAIEVAKDNQVVKKYGNMDLSMLIDRADDILSGRYADHSKRTREPKRGNGLKLTAASNNSEFDDDI